MLLLFCDNLIEINLSENLEKIERGAFNFCSSLASIDLPNNLKIIESYAFEGCTGLSSIILPNSLNRLESNVFKGCSKLTSITLPSKLDTVFKSSFPNSKKLILTVTPDSPMEAWVKEKGFQYNSILNETVKPGLPKSRTGALTVEAVRKITHSKLTQERSSRIDAIKKEIVELNSELSALTGWFKGRQRRELQERIGEKKAELEKLEK